jgi:hypothetical protein
VQNFDILRFSLMYVLLPVWLIAGFIDYFCHRWARIEHTSGVKESVLHLAGLFEIGVPILAVLFFKVNALILFISAVGLVAHESTFIWDVHYANGTRVVSALEQHLHALLELIPWFGFLIIAVLHWQNLVGEPLAESMAMSAKEPPLDVGYRMGIIAAALIFGLAPYVEELVRCARAPARNALARTPPPAGE